MTPVNKPIKTPRKPPAKVSLEVLIRIRGGAGITFPACDGGAKDAG